MPAMIADQRRERVAVEPDEAATGEPRRTAGGIEHGSGNVVHGWPPPAGGLVGAAPHCAATVASAPPAVPPARRLASIWPMASTTASKVSMVEAWRAL